MYEWSPTVSIDLLLVYMFALWHSLSYVFPSSLPVSTSVATCPDSYPQLIELDFHNTLLQLLGHENADIAMCVADLLREMLDVDPLNEGVEGAQLLSQQLLEGQVMSLLVSLLGKLDEKNAEESQGVHNIIG